VRAVLGVDAARIDALVCAWVGMKYLAGEAVAYGDETAAIWVPTP
jgi:hypothetical protein